MWVWLGKGGLQARLKRLLAPLQHCSLELEAAGTLQHCSTCAPPSLSPPAFPQMRQAPPTNLSRPVSLGGGLYVCGDHRTTATLDGALKSGRQAAEAVLADLRR